MNFSTYLRNFAAFSLITTLIAAPHAARSLQRQTATPANPQTSQSTPTQSDPQKKQAPTPVPSATSVQSSKASSETLPAVAPKHAGTPPAQNTSPQKSLAPGAREADSVQFEKLLADESYMIVGEMRALNQYLQSPMMRETLALYEQLGEMPREMRLLQDFAARNGDALDSARISFAVMPMRPDLPQMLFSVQFTDERTARELTPQLRRLVAAIANSATANFRQGTPAIRPGTEEPKKSTETNAETAVKSTTAKSGTTAPSTERAAKNDGYYAKQVGSLLLLSEKEFKLEDLKPITAAASLAENPRYQQVQAQFGSESSVVFCDLKLVEREFKRMMKEQQVMVEKAQAEAKALAEAKAIKSAATGIDPKVATISDDVALPTLDDEATAELAAVEGASPPALNIEEASDKIEPEQGATLTTDSVFGADSGESVAIPSLGLIFSPAMFGGGLTQMLGSAEALGIGASLESDAAAVRLLFVTPEKKSINPIPFLPMLIAGAPAAPRAAAMLPADTDLFVSMSVDLAHTYDEVLGVANKAMRMQTEQKNLLRELDKPIDTSQPSLARTENAKNEKNDAGQISPAQLAIAMVEQRYGFKIKDELIASLGSEVAFGMLHSKPSEAKDATVTVKSAKEISANVETARADEASKMKAKDGDENKAEAASAFASPGYVVLIHVTDRERLKRLLPLALEAAGMRLPNVGNFAFQKRGDAEFITFALGSAAFVGDYLVIAPDAPTLDRIVAVAGGGSSLVSNEKFIAARAWQPREKLAELYVSGEIIESLFAGERRELASFDEGIKSFFDAHQSSPEPLTYFSTGDSQGTLHEIRFPRSAILSFTAQAAADAKHGEKLRNERYANYRLTALAAAQSSFHTKEKRYGTFEEMRKADLIWETELSSNGYTLRLNVSPNKFDATATPDAYNVTGRRSFYIDDTGTLRAADHGGRPATAADPEAK